MVDHCLGILRVNDHLANNLEMKIGMKNYVKKIIIVKMPYCTHLISDEDGCHPFEMRNTLMTKTDFEIHF